MARILVLFLMGFSSLAWSAGSSDPDLKGRSIVLEDKMGKFEVRVAPKSGRVDVYTLRSGAGNEENQIPRSATITLFRDLDTTQVVELQAISPPSESAVHYQGKLSQAASSFMGVELKFRFPQGSGPERILRSKSLPSK